MNIYCLSSVLINLCVSVFVVLCWWCFCLVFRVLLSALQWSPATRELQKSGCCLLEELYLTDCIFCAFFPLTKTPSCTFFNIIICPPFLSFLHSFILLSFLLFAALLPNFGHLSHLPLVVLPWSCDAMTVSFTRVSHVSSLSLCHSVAPTTWTHAQPQHWPAEEWHDHLCFSWCGPRPFTGENSPHSFTN